MTVGIGLIAPPVGLNVYVVNNLARDVPMAETYKGVFPFLAWDALRVLLLHYLPLAQTIRQFPVPVMAGLPPCSARPRFKASWGPRTISRKASRHS
jgi:hypothetical protein